MARPIEVLRRIYHDLVRRRARVRVVSAEHVSLTEPPIFILGAYGSGTTLVRYVIDSHSRICCPPESDFIDTMEPLVKNGLPRRGLEAMGFDQEAVLQRVRGFVSELFGNYASSWNKPRWADKSPSYVDHTDYLARLFPTAQFLLVFRHGLDQAHSYTRGGTFDREPLVRYAAPGEDLRLASARYWVRQCEKLLAFESEHTGRTARLRYEDLCANPEGELRRVFKFLGEDWEPAVLDFATADHDQGNEHGRVIATRGFEARSGHYREWSPELAAEGFNIVGPTLRRLGYDPDAR